ncbi:MAG: peptidoglycan-associated lipoprotein Pal [Gammaproteobacteria bacterium]|nr:peptidoglycan-associated lipoprotein Pal [Gammaproteobacteria bacterium]
MNKIFNFKKIHALAFAVIFVSACGTKSTEDVMVDSGPVDDQQSSDDTTAYDSSSTSSLDGGDGAELTPIADDYMTAQQQLDQVDSPLTSRTIYFDYNSAKISDESLAVLEVHGNFISGNGEVNVRLAGHTDERGSREYNIALGDRRAQSVRRVLLFQGASTDQVDTISYGEEQPAISGHNDAAWMKNRRVELIYSVN